MIYDNLTKVAHLTKVKTTFNYSFIRQARIDIKGDPKDQFLVKFFDHKTNKFIHQSIIKGNMWSSPFISYFIKWRIEVYDLQNNKLDEHVFDASNKKVYISLESKALGDTLAWIPYVEKFRKEHNCKVVCSTFHNEWFETKYPEIEFIKPGQPSGAIYAMYSVGWYFKDEGHINTDKHPFDPRHYSLQKTASDILGIPFTEIKPNISYNTQKVDIKEPYIVIAPHASSHAKYWNAPNGWQSLIDWAKSQNYKVVMATQEPLGDEWHDSKLGGTLKNVIDKTGCDFDEACSLIKKAKSFVGVSSGLSWLSWTLNTPTVLISGFTEPKMEMSDCYRVYTPEGFCRGCQSTDRLDAGDWKWCPFHKNTNRHFECTTNISPDTVILNLKKSLNIY